jgi:hypothetical protein
MFKDFWPKIKNYYLSMIDYAYVMYIVVIGETYVHPKIKIKFQ